MGRDEQRPPRRPVGAAVVSFIAGVWMIVMAAVFGWSRGGAYGWSWGWHGQAYNHAARLWWTWIGIIAGIIVLIGTAALFSRRAVDVRGWGVVILVVSIIDLIFGAGGIGPGILGIIAGLLALFWRP